MDLPEFLLARYSEREATLRTLLESKMADELPELARGPAFFIDAHDDGLLGQPSAVQEMFADLAAKRAIVQWAVVNPLSCVDVHPGHDIYHFASHDHPVLELLAQPFAAHPDFDPAWR